MISDSRLGSYCALLAVLFLSSCDNVEEADTRTQPVRPVKLITIEEADAIEVHRFPAVIGANRLSELSFQVGGTLTEFRAKEAQVLERGDLIAQLDRRDFKSAADAAKAQYESAEAEYQRAVRLAAEDAIAGNVIEQRKTQLDVSKAQLDQTEKALADSVLRAPFSGVVAETLVKNFQTISAGTVVVKLMAEDLLKATIDLPANIIAHIPKQESEDQDEQIFVFLDAAPDQPIGAKFDEASLIADTVSQTYAVTFTFPPPSTITVLPGMNATVEVRRNNTKGSTRVAVPLHAVSNDGENHYVWIVNRESMTVAKRVIAIEKGVGEAIIVAGGLEANDTIVGAGGAYLSEGMEVREWK